MSTNDALPSGISHRRADTGSQGSSNPLEHVGSDSGLKSGRKARRPTWTEAGAESRPAPFGGGKRNLLRLNCSRHNGELRNKLAVIRKKGMILREEKQQSRGPPLSWCGTVARGLGAPRIADGTTYAHHLHVFHAGDQMGGWLCASSCVRFVPNFITCMCLWGKPNHRCCLLRSSAI